MGRSPCCVKEGLNRGAWTAMEDKILIDYIKTHGEGRWRNLPKKAGLKRCGKSCRLRWMNYLRPDIKRGNITLDEEELIIRLHKLLGNRWSLIAGRLPGRTDNEIKNYWNANLSKRVNQCSSNQAPNNTLTTTLHNKRPRNQLVKKKPLTTIDEPTTSKHSLLSSNVVRTKAIRCTKVFINPQPEPQILRGNNNINTTSSEATPPCSADFNGSNNNDSSPELDEEYKIPSSSEFMMDEDLFMDDFNLVSELLNSDFSSIIGDFSNNESSNDANDLLSPTSPQQQPFVLSQELLEDWLGDHHQVM